VNGDGYSDVIVAGGGAYRGVYHGSAAGLAAVPAWTASSGDCVGTAGDVNGDGYSDIIVAESAGPAVYQGSAAGLATTPIWTGQYSVCAATAGDVNGDGFSDVIVGNDYGTAGYGGPRSTMALRRDWRAWPTGLKRALRSMLTSARPWPRRGT